jgi:Tol biopolymer transport system component
MKTRRSLRFGAVIIAVVAGLLALTASAGGSISPKADQIAFMSTLDGEADIYTMNLTGLMNKNLTHDETIGMRTDVEPAWSPTGEYVAFQRNFIKAEEFGAQLYRVATTGKELGPITPLQKGVVDTHPSWSPDGNSIVFSSDRDGNFELYTVKASGFGLTQLTHTKLGIENLEPAWSPDGEMIVFTQRRGDGDTVSIRAGDLEARLGQALQADAARHDGPGRPRRRLVSGLEVDRVLE